MAIQMSDVVVFFELLAEALPWFIMFKCHNYANSVTISLALWLQLREWKHPLVEWLKVHFKATSEEYGETAIHFMCSHLNESKYEGVILEERWRDTGVAMEIFNALDLERSHKPSSAKIFQSSNPNLVYRAIHSSFTKLLAGVESGSHRCFVYNPKSGYTSNSKRETTDGFWAKRFGIAERGKMMKKAVAHCDTIYSKLTKSIVDESYQKVDLSWAFE